MHNTVQDPKTMTPAELILGFERDIRFDCHGYTARFERSWCQQELVRRGKEVLPEIVEHLKAHPPTEEQYLHIAWGHLLNRIEIKIDPEKGGPALRSDTPGWIAWAERMLAA